MKQKENSRFRQLQGYQLKLWNFFLLLIPLTGVAYILSVYNLFDIMIYREQYFGVFLALFYSVSISVYRLQKAENRKRAFHGMISF